MKLPLSFVLLAAVSNLCPGQTDQAQQDARLLADSLGAFTARLVANDKAQDNLCLSPASAGIAMLMAYAGASGETAEALANMLAPEGWDADRIHAAAAALDARLQRDTDGFQLANQQDVWSQSGYPLLASYRKVMRDSYHASFESLDFDKNPDAARKFINRQISRKTQGLIEELLQPGMVSRATRLILTNTLYLNAKWQHQFDANDTYSRNFTLPGGKNKLVKSMFAEASFPALQQQGRQVVRLAYQGGDFALDLVLPANTDDLPEALAMLLTSNGEDWQKKLTDERLRLWLPRFSIQTHESLIQRMGDSALPLGAGADFSKATSDPRGLFISEIIQATSIDVAEQGTRAAAATAVLLV